MSKDRPEAKNKTAILKDLREEHKDTVERAQSTLKIQQSIRKLIRGVIDGSPKTVPEIAACTNLASNEVLWHITAMKKYDLVNEVGMSGEYYQYTIVQETKS